MGDRANIVIETPLYRKEGEMGRVYLYSHWRGEDIVNSAIKGLESGRSTDSTYLTRIIFQDMLGGDDSETGFGIGPQLEDNEHPIVVIRPEGEERGKPSQPTVHIERMIGSQAEIAWGPKSYEEFIAAWKAQESKSWNKLEAVIEAG